ncbi:hypothetical protein SERLADRAFT_477875 [Serpula lacrymans var. lacrymans S7.9]|uniref:Uncharacterized protein n=1 Tax=Serpula lacrymans var. lacrymans (strain S7.9) TaxID=578457 RepID=F8P9N9_SERL9|nr:uncharacterized protein SERLADRAFT_477875 [Serpula lacrymans var. lacrymans S7.9]EGO20368.1 hypothetical protein SERLADRAFT_477875 [Serpula lacrymans var. lacrymans S7.9]
MVSVFQLERDVVCEVLDEVEAPFLNLSIESQLRALALPESTIPFISLQCLCIAVYQRCIGVVMIF